MVPSRQKSDIDTRPVILLLRLTPDVYSQSSHPIGHRPPYILKYIEAILREEKTMKVRMVDQCISDASLPDIEAEIRRVRPAVIIFDVSSLNEAASAALSMGLREQAEENLLLVAVGHAPSADIEAFRTKHPQFHVILAGEAEEEAVKIIHAVNAGQSPKMLRQRYSAGSASGQRAVVQDLNTLPFPHYDPQELRKYTFVYPLRLAKRIVWGHLLSSRGCPHGCVFCSQIMRESYGTVLRTRSASNVADEVEQLLRAGANVISFDDDNFTSSQSHVRAVCEEILRRELNIRWIAHARVDEIDEPLLCLMRDSGCVLLRYGVETVNPDILKRLGKTPDPSAWPEKTRAAVTMTQAHGIAAACLFMIGCPGETHENVKNDIRFAQDLNPDIIQVAYFTPFPGSRYYELFKEKFSGPNMPELYHYTIPRINLSHMNNHEFSSAQGHFYKRFLLRPVFIWKHARNYFLFYARNPDIFCELLKIKDHLLKSEGAR